MDGTSRVSRFWLAWVFAALAFAVAAIAYGWLPDAVPTRWGPDGEVTQRIAKPFGPFMLPLGSLLVIAIALIVPRISPRGYRIERFAAIYPTLVAAMSGLLLYLTVVTLLAAAGRPVRLPAQLLAGIGAFLAVTGNYTGKITRNFFFGIRTPWTLASEVVWDRTHRFAAWTFVAGGLLTVALAVATALPALLLLAVLVATVLAPCVYSYALWRRLEGGGEAAGTH